MDGLKAEIAKGEDFADLARKYSEDLISKDSGGLLGVMDEKTAPKPFVDAVKKLKEGDVSGIVETPEGLHLIRLNSLTVAKAPTYEERKDAIKKDLQTAKATPLYFDSLEKLRDLAFNSPDLSEPASAIGAKIHESNAITRNGGGEGLFANQKVYREVFKDNVLKNGENSDVIEVSPDHAVVVRVKKYNPSSLLPFERVIAQAHDLVTTEKAKVALAKKADEVEKKIRDGEAIDKVANADGDKWQVELASKRTNPKSDREIISAAFRLPAATGKAFAIDKIQKSNGDYVVLTVSNVQDGTTKDYNPMEIPMLKNYMVRAKAVEEFNALEASLKSKANIDIY